MGKLNPFFLKIHSEIKVRKEIFMVTKHPKFGKRIELKRGTIASVSTKIGSNFRFKGKRTLIQQLETIKKKIIWFDLTQIQIDPGIGHFNTLTKIVILASSTLFRSKIVQEGIILKTWLISFHLFTTSIIYLGFLAKSTS